MKLRLSALREGANALDETLAPGELGLDEEEFIEPVRVAGEVINDPAMIDVRLHIETEAEAVCDRCAVDFKRPIRTDHRVMIMRRDAEDMDEEEAEGLLFVGEDENEVDLTQEIVDAVMLDRPMKILCRTACKGLCPICYTDWNEETCEHYAEHGPEASGVDND